MRLGLVIKSNDDKVENVGTYSGGIRKVWDKKFYQSWRNENKGCYVSEIDEQIFSNIVRH